jgi:hypothetical protein
VTIFHDNDSAVPAGRQGVWQNHLLGKHECDGIVVIDSSNKSGRRKFSGRTEYITVWSILATRVLFTLKVSSNLNKASIVIFYNSILFTEKLIVKLELESKTTVLYLAY